MKCNCSEFVVVFPYDLVHLYIVTKINKFSYKLGIRDVRGKPLINLDRQHKTPGADNRPLPSSSYCLNVQDTMQDTTQIVAKC